MSGRRPFHPIDAAWLHMEHPANLMMITGVFELDGELDRPRLLRLVEDRLCRVDRFTSRAVEPRLPLGLPSWEPDPDFDLAYHLQEVPPSPGRAALPQLVSELMSTPLDPARPLWQLHVVPDLDGGTALICRLHHAIADGMALMRLLLTLDDEGPGPEPSSAPRPGMLERVLRPAREAAAATWRWSHALLQQGREVVSHPAHVLDLAGASIDAVKELTHLTTLPPDPDTCLRGALQVRQTAAWSRPLGLARVKAVRQAVGATVNDVLMGALCGGLRAYLAERGQALDGLTIRAVVPVDLRPEGDRTLGNHFGLVLLSLPVGVADPHDQLQALKQNMDALKQSPQAVVSFGLLNTVGVLPRALEDQVIEYFGQRATLVVTNVPGPREPLRLAGSPLRSLMFWVPRSGQLGLGVSIISYAGAVRVGVAADAGLVPDPERLVQLVEAAFETLERVERRD